jgi:tryptophan synthase alpha chain
LKNSTCKQRSMNRIDSMFQEKKEEVLSIYMTAGFPALEDTVPILQSLQSAGADMAEIGIPFSDPLADGPVIQQSSQRALSNGMSLRVLFGQLRGIRESVSIPLLLMGYLNPILRFGMEEFLAQCGETGIDGLIIPDLPPDEYESEYKSLFESHGIHNVLLITPHSSPQRIRRMASLSGGFLYMVAEASTTGARSTVEAHQVEYFRRIGKMELPLPCLVGFGISSHETFRAACRQAPGAIVGSAFIKAIQEEGDIGDKVTRFIRMIREG